MKLHWSPRSPYVRKVMILAHETGLADRFELVRSVVALTSPNAELMHDNPMSRIPTLVLDDGTVLYDSPVICEYLDGLHSGPKMIPAEPSARMQALRRQALGDGILDTLILWLNERNRPKEKQSESFFSAFTVKTLSALEALESEAPSLAADPFSVGHIAIGSALCYLDFRFQSEQWREGRPQLERWHAGFDDRPSVRAVPIIDDR